MNRGVRLTDISYDRPVEYCVIRDFKTGSVRKMRVYGIDFDGALFSEWNPDIEFVNNGTITKGAWEFDDSTYHIVMSFIKHLTVKKFHYESDDEMSTSLDDPKYDIYRNDYVIVTEDLKPI